MVADAATLFLKACSSGKAKAVERLLENGLSTDTRDEYGLTGLILAGRKGRVEVAEVLLTAGADVEGKDRRGRTALFHAVTMRRHAFVEKLAAVGADVSTVDLHDWAPVDFARRNSDPKMVALLERLGALGKQVVEAPSESAANENTFWLGAYAIGGPNFSESAREQQVQLGNAMKRWKGEYTGAVKQFVFRLAIDGSLESFTKLWNVRGAKEASRYRDRIEVKIAVPEDWWESSAEAYKKHLTSAVDEGLRSMIALLKRNNHPVEDRALLEDWEKVKAAYLSMPAPGIPGAEKRAVHDALVQEMLREFQAKKAGDFA